MVGVGCCCSETGPTKGNVDPILGRLETDDAAAVADQILNP